MRSAKLAAAVLLALAPCACRKPEPRHYQLKTALQAVPMTAPCDTIIPMEWFTSLPVPTGAAQGREFKVFFYPRGQPGAADFVNAPLGEAVFDSDGKVASCRRFPGARQGLAARRWPKAVDGASVSQLQLSLDELYAATEAVAALYAAQAPVAEPAQKTMQDYGRRFTSLAEPALLAYYRALNPGFWDWLGRSGAPALAADRR